MSTTVDCEGSWGAWNSCSESCGDGAQQRDYTVSTPAQNGGAACPTESQETQSCSDGPCPVNCDGAFGDWGGCSEACGGGTQSRSFAVTTAASNGGTACPADETQSCNSQACDVDCMETGNTAVDCLDTCAVAAAAVTTAQSGTGAPCLGDYTCLAGDGACPADVNCVGSFGSWSSCSLECGGGLQSRLYAITTPASGGGMECPSSTSQACNTQNCLTSSAAPSIADGGDYRTVLMASVSRADFVSALQHENVNIIEIVYEMKAEVALNGLSGDVTDYTCRSNLCQARRTQLVHAAATAAGVASTAVEIISYAAQRRQLGSSSSSSGRRRLAVSAGLEFTSSTGSDLTGLSSSSGFSTAFKAAANMSPAEIASLTGLDAADVAMASVDATGLSVEEPVYTTSIQFTATTPPSVDVSSPSTLSSALASIGAPISAAAISVSAADRTNYVVLNPRLDPIGTDAADGSEPLAIGTVAGISAAGSAAFAILMALLYYGCKRCCCPRTEIGNVSPGGRRRVHDDHLDKLERGAMDRLQNIISDKATRSPSSAKNSSRGITLVAEAQRRGHDSSRRATMPSNLGPSKTRRPHVEPWQKKASAVARHVALPARGHGALSEVARSSSGQQHGPETSNGRSRRSDEEGSGAKTGRSRSSSRHAAAGEPTRKRRTERSKSRQEKV